METLATTLPITITFESRRKKIQRFLSLPKLKIEKIWFPIVTTWLSTYFQPEKIIYVVIDRTAWGTIGEEKMRAALFRVICWWHE